MKITQFFLQADDDVKGSRDPYRRQAQIQASIDEVETCPICGAGISPKLLSSVYYRQKGASVSSTLNTGVILYRCPSCYNAFLAQYNLASNSPDSPPVLGPTGFFPEHFPEDVSSVSPSFVSVYNQALEAESRGLTEICGMGYRKSLEFLIKDYLIFVCSESEAQIRASALSACIQTYITNENLKVVASRAVWLGNDFTHYEQRFSEYDVNDLKRFIDATVSWIHVELTTREALNISPRR